MKKFYFMLVSLVLMVTTANAQVSSMTDLYGKYKFTAKITTTDAGKDYADKFKNDCEVVITKSESQYFMGSISGLAGADYSMDVASFDESANTFTVNGPNNANYGIWDGYIAVANTNGDWPYMTSAEGSEQFAMVYKFNPETKEITIDDFSIVQLAWQPAETATLLANVTDVKLSLIEAETIVIPDIAGEWKFSGEPRYDVAPRSFTMNLTATDETMKNWEALMTFEGYEDEAITLPATFDGTVLTIPFNNIYISQKDKIRFGLSAPASAVQGELSFAYVNKTAMSIRSNIYLRKEAMVLNEDTGLEELQAKILQTYYYYYYIEREDPNAYNWAGVYNVTVGDNDVRFTNEDETFPNDFKMVVEKVPGGYEITEFLGFEIDSYYRPAFNIGSEENTAEITLSGYEYLKMWEDPTLTTTQDATARVYYQLTDINSGTTSIPVTLNSDGTATVGSFAVTKLVYEIVGYSSDLLSSDAVAVYRKATMERDVYDWSGTYVLTGEVTKADAEDTTECPASFEVVVKYNEAEAYYCVMEIMGNDAYMINSGLFELIVAADGRSATLNNGNVYSYGEGYFLKMFDADAQKNPIKVTLNADGTLNIEDFSVVYGFYDDTELKTIAYYKNVAIAKKDTQTSIEDVEVENAAVEGIFDVQGRRINEITAPGLYIVNGKKVLVK